MSAREAWLWECPLCDRQGIEDDQDDAYRYGREHIAVSHPTRSGVVLALGIFGDEVTR